MRSSKVGKEGICENRYKCLEVWIEELRKL